MAIDTKDTKKEKSRAIAEAARKAVIKISETKKEVGQKSALIKTKPPEVKVKDIDVGGVNAVKSTMNKIASSFPHLKKTLKQADLNISPAEFVENALRVALIVAVVLEVCAFFIMSSSQTDLIWMAPLFPIFYVVAFMYWMQYPIVKTKQRRIEIDRELVFAGRQMMIELKAGVPLFDAMLSISKDYGEVSKEFKNILERMTVGVAADLAMHESAENNPSPAFRRVVMQLVNSLRSGSDVAAALESVLDQISKEQVLEMRAYGQKLNPLAMFYMIFGTILPSLGVALAVTFFSFASIEIDVGFLGGLLLLIAIAQLMFLTLISSSRPKFEMAG
ncbi:MAG: type II secretion system F family protein [Candidatus Micrarchaeota archaeon]